MSKFTITVRGNQHELLFGRAAAEEATKRLLDVNRLTDNNFRNVQVLIYSGLLNAAIKEDLEQYPVWEDVHDLTEQFHEEEDSVEQYDEMYRLFSQSRWGKEVIDGIQKAANQVDALNK